MVSGAKTELTIGRKFKQDRIDIQRLKSRIRQQRSPGARIPPRFGTGPSGVPFPAIQRLATKGDSMIGPIAFFPQAVTVAAGVIDIGIQTSDYSSRIIVLGQASVADDLDTILNARFAGQFLILQAVATTPITLKHLTGNIRIPSGIDYVVKGLESVILVFDSTSNEWVLVQGDSGITNPLTANLDFAGFDAVNLDAISWEDGDVEESVATGIKWTLALNHAIEIQNSSLVRQVFIDTQAPSFDLNILLRMVGSVEQTRISQLDGAAAAFQIETVGGQQWLFKMAGTNVFQVVEQVATTEYAFNPLVVGDGGFKYFFESGTYFTGSPTSGRINVYNDAVNRYAFTNNEFVILNSENLVLTGTGDGGFMQVKERAADPGALANTFRFYGKDVAGITKAFLQFSDATVIEIGVGGAGDIISEGDSSVEVIDAGTGVVDIKLDGIVDWTFSALKFLPATGRDGLNDIGSDTLRPRVIYSDEFDIQDDQVSNPAGGGATRIAADQGGMNLGVSAGDDEYDFEFGGVSEFKILEDGEIQFNTVGRQHKIVPQSASLDIVSENQADEINLFTGAVRTNKTLEIGDTESVFLTENDQVNQYRLVIRQEHNTPLAGRAIGNLIWSAENTSSINHDYAIQEAESSGITGGSEQGRWRVGVTVNGSIGVVGMELIGVSTALRMGFFGVTPVVKQNPAVNSTAIHAALQALGFFV